MKQERRFKTEKDIESIGARFKEVWYSDELCPSLHLRVNKRGVKCFVVRKQTQKKHHYLSLGVFPNLSLDEARKKAIEAGKKWEKEALLKRVEQIKLNKAENLFDFKIEEVLQPKKKCFICKLIERIKGFFKC